ncbi:MAG: hypothetical protein WCK27_28525 [Verrucomicrobiota bacterium]
MKNPEKERTEETPEIDRAAVDKIDITVSQVGQPAQPSSSEAAQEEFNAALQDFNTEVKGGLRQSLNSATPHARIEDILKEKAKE